MTNGAIFEVSLSGEIGLKVKRLAKTASARGIKDKFIAALEAIYHKLRHDPLNFGERSYELQQFSCHIGVLGPVAVHFHVHDRLQLVFLANVFLMSD